MSRTKISDGKTVFLHTWPAARLAEMIEALAQRSDLSMEQTMPPTHIANTATVEEAMHSAASNCGVEAEPVTVSYTALSSFFGKGGPAVFPITETEETRYLAVLRRRPQVLVILGPDGTEHRAMTKAVCAALCQALEAPHRTQVDELLASAGVAERRRRRARRNLLRQRLHDSLLRGWVLEPALDGPLWPQLLHIGLPGRLAVLVVAHAAQFGLWLTAWWLIGRVIFQVGDSQLGLDLRVFWAWALLLLGQIPLRLIVTWIQGDIVARAGGFLQKRLLYGAMRLHPDQIRRQGVGELVGRVFEAEAFETLVINGGLLAAIALIELMMAAWVLYQGAGGGLLLGLLFLWCGVLGALALRFARRFHNWTEARRTLTHDLVEKLAGNRTRQVQCPPPQWHAGEWQAMDQYSALARRMDRAGVQWVALAARGWLVAGLAGLAPALLSGQHAPAALAVSLGGILSAELALNRLSHGMTSLIGASVSWRQIAPIFRAAAGASDETEKPPAFLDDSAKEQAPCASLLALHRLDFGYLPGAEPVLRDVNLHIAAGDRVLLEGDSGSGKTTLAVLLARLRKPARGRLLLHGVDCGIWGDQAWRRRVVLVPQFHDNYVLSHTFLFNLLMGRGWPPRREDIHAAQEVCEAVGLGNLLRRMPAGLHQIVGETGWQLSHGERSRLYIARALLQSADLLVLDESFAALDPESLQQSLTCVLERAPALAVIAHP